MSPPGIAEEQKKSRTLPSSWGTLMIRLHVFQSDSGRTVVARPLRQRSVAPGDHNTEAPTIGISELNSTAFGLAVYASQCGLPQHHARLASSCWSGSTGRDSHPQGSDERFQSCYYISFPFPKLTWRNWSDHGAKLQLGKSGSISSSEVSIPTLGHPREFSQRENRHH